ncbi:MAG: class I SAM-dependent methyltransferase [Candidatus Sulfotelmatobacter sp.]
MEVHGDDVAVWIVVGERCDCRLRVARPVENTTLTLLRHPLSPYRRLAQLTIRKLRLIFTISWGNVNRLHQWLCRSDRWRSTVAQRLPWAIGNTELGPNVLEIGPGPGLTTDLLRTSVPRLTALEIDATLAGSLNSRLKGSSVQVIEGDATKMPFGDAEFSGAVSFTMLHHLPSRELQNRVLAEVFRVLKPGGFFVGSDSLQNWFMRIIHIGDTLVPVNPDTFGARLERVGFEVLEVHKNSRAFRFRARRPTA